MLVSALTLYACGTDEINLTVNESTIDTAFTVNDFDLNEIELIYTVGDETSIVTLDETMLEEALPTEAGEHTLTASYLDETISFTITLEESALTQTLMSIYDSGISEGLIDFDSYEAWLESIQGEDGISITEASINNSGELILTFSDGQSHNAGLVKAEDGEDGVSVVASSINGDGELIITLSNGDTLNVGEVVGTDGQDGTDGSDGQDGISVSGSTINSDGELIITLSNGDSINAGEVVGTDGQDGTDGTDGEDGISITDSSINDDGDLIITLSNNDTINVGNVMGEDGAYVENSTINEAGELIFTLSSGETINAGAIVQETDLEIDFRYYDGTLQWRYLDGNWHDLTPSQADEEIYTVKFKEPFSGTLIKEKEVSENTPLVFPSVQMIGYDNVGWFSDLNFNYEVEYYDYIESDLTLYVKWERAEGQGYELRAKETIDYDRILSGIDNESHPSRYHSQHVSGDYTIGVVTGNLDHYATYLFIPNTLDGNPVEMIDEEALADTNNLKELFLPANLHYIRDYAFLSSSINLIHYTSKAQLTHIGHGAFEASDLQSLFVPHYVKIIGQNAFKDTHQLEEVTFESNSHQTPGTFKGALLLKPSAFKNSAVETINFPTIAVEFLYRDGPEGPDLNLRGRVGGLYIADEAFKNTDNLTNVDLPEQTFLTRPTVTNFNPLPDYILELYPQTNESIFQGSGLKTIHIPLPDTISGAEHQVVIPDKMFKNTEDLETVSLAEGIESIWRNAFENSAIEHLDLPDTIGYLGFESTFKNTPNLHSIALPDQVEEISFALFKDSGLQEIIISSDSNLETINNSAFENSSLESIILPASIETIGISAFRNTQNLSSVIFDGEYFKHDISIRQSAFRNSGLETIIFPNSNENEEHELTFESMVFKETINLSSIDFPDNTHFSGFATRMFKGSGIESITVPNTIISIPAQWFKNTPNLRTVNLHDDITTISSDVFNNAQSLENITLPEGLESIRERAFKNTNNLDNLTLPKTVSGISREAFKNSNLHTFDIPDDSALTDIGPSVFKNVENLSSIALPNSLETIGSGAFENTGLEAIVIPQAVTSINENLFKDASFLHTIELHADITSLGDNAFAGTTSLESITLPPLDDMEAFEDLFADSAVSVITLTIGTQTIPDNLFKNLTSLTQVNLPDSIVSIGSRAFENTENLHTLNFAGTDEVNHANDALEIISERAFENSGLESLHFSPNASLTLIDDNAFRDAAIQEITLPNSLTEIGLFAFLNSDIETVHIDEDSSLESLGTGSFAYSNLESIFIPEHVSSLQTSAFGLIGIFEGSNLSDITFADDSTLEHIGRNTFANTNLKEITIPQSVETMHQDVFLDTDIETIIFEGMRFEGVMAPQEVDVPEMSFIDINADAFRGLDTLKTLEINRTVEDGLLPEGLFDDLDNLETLMLPINLQTLNAGALANKENLTDLELPMSLNVIEESTFENTGIISLTLPATLQHIETAAFRDASDLEEIIFTSDETLETIGEEAFKNTVSLTTIKLLDGDENTLPNSLIELGESAFEGSGIESLTLREDALLEEIPRATFQDASLNEITMHDGLETIGNIAFINTPLETVKLSEGSNLNEINVGAFKNTSLSSFYLPRGVEVLPYTRGIKTVFPTEYQHNGVFTGSDLETITFAEGSLLESIEAYTFADTNLTEIDLPDYVDFIGEYAFKNTDVESLEIAPQEGVMLTLEEKAFSQMSSIKEINITADMEMLPQGVFKDLDTLETVVLPQTITTIPAEAFKNTVSLNDVTLSRSLRTIERSAFAHTGLTALDLSNEHDLTHIGREAFLESALESLTLPASLEEIGSRAFYGNRDLSEVVILEVAESNLEVISHYAFKETAITEFSVPQTLQVIGRAAFANTPLETFNIIESAQDVPFLQPIDLPNFRSVDDEIAPFYNVDLAQLTIYLWDEEAFDLFLADDQLSIYEEYYQVVED